MASVFGKKILPCEHCRALGWVKGPTEWPIACPKCEGLGRFRVANLARVLRVSPKDIYRVCRMKPCPVVGARLLERIAEVFPRELGLEPRGAPFDDIDARARTVTARARP